MKHLKREDKFINFKKGFSLSITLFIAVILLSVSSYFLYLSKERIINSKKLVIKLNTFIKAKDYFEKIKYYLGTGKYENFYVMNSSIKGLPIKLRLDSYEYRIDDVMFSLQDSSGLVNMFVIDVDMLNKMFRANSKRSILINSLLDWLDKDSFQRIGGAEYSWYKIHGYSYGPRNKNFIAYLDELIDIRDWSSLFYKYKIFLTFNRGSNYNYMVMPPFLLKIRYGFTDEQIKKIFLLKNKYKIDELLDFFYKNKHYYNYDIDMPYLSRVVKIRVISTEENISSILEGVIDFKNDINLYY
jgi:hypothetical protein